MRHIAFLLPGLLCCTASVAVAQSVRVLSWNIKEDIPDSKQISWRVRRPFVREVILAEDPDVIGLQESQLHQVTDLIDALPKYAVFKELTKKPDVYDSLIMWKASKFELVSADHFWLGPNPDVPISWPPTQYEAGFYTPRSVSCVTLRHRKSEHVAVYCNTHYNGQASIGLRSSELIGQRVLDHNDRVVLMGDFNAMPHDPDHWPSEPEWMGGVVSFAYKSLLKRQMVDTFKVANPNVRSVASGCGWLKKCIDFKQDTRIDWVMSKGFQVDGAHMVEARMPNRLPVSDHWPQIADLSFAP